VVVRQYEKLKNLVVFEYITKHIVVTEKNLPTSDFAAHTNVSLTKNYPKLPELDPGQHLLTS